MTAKEVSVGLTYEVLVSDKLVPVKLSRECPYGGWYGTNLATGHDLRIKTAGRLRKQLTSESERQAALEANEVHTSTMEATVPTITRNTASTDAKAARAARRANKSTTTTTKESTVTTATNDAPYGLKADGTPRKRPVPTWLNGDQPTAKPAAAKPAARRAKVAAEIAEPVMTQTDIDAAIAAAVAAALAEVGVKPATRVAAKPASGKPVVVKLKAGEAKVNSYSFKYAGKDENPLVTAVYLMIPLLEQFAADGEPVEIAFNQYVPRAKQKGQPKSKIRYSGSEDTIRDLYVDRDAITKLGYSESNPPVVTVKVTGEDTITLQFPAA